MKNFSYFEPEKAAAAFDLLAEHKDRAKILAGGTELLPQMKRGLASPEVVVSLSKIPAFKEMKEVPEGFKIGATVPLGVLERSHTISSSYPVLHEAVRQVAAPAIRNSGTIGGNICLDTKCIYRDQTVTWERALAPCFKRGGRTCYVVPGSRTCHASLAADTVPALIALGARVRILSSKEEKTVPLESLYTGNGVQPLSLAGEEILGEVILPRPQNGMRSAYQRYSLRKAIDFPSASAAVCLAAEKEICTQATVVLGAVAPQPLRLARLETALQGKKLREEFLKDVCRQAAEEARQISKSGRIDAFARSMISSLVFRALRKACPWLRE